MATVRNLANPSEPVDRKYAGPNRFIPSTSIAVTAPLYAGEKIVSSDTGARYVGIAPEIGAWGKLASKFVGGSSSGGFPDAATTGFTPGTTFTLIDNQLLRSTADGQVFENLHLTNSDMIVTHDFVTIRNCWFDSAVANNALRVYDDGTGGGNSVVIEDCTFFGHNNCTNAILLNGSLGASVSRCDISGCDNGINVGTNNCLIEDCYVHDLNNTVAVDPHYDCIEVNGGLDDLVVTHCTLINTNSQTGCFQLNNFFGAQASNNQLVENCRLIDGGSSPIYCDGRFTPAQPMQNVTIKDCRILPSHNFGYVALVYNTLNWQWINNVHDVTGVVLVDPGVNP